MGSSKSGEKPVQRLTRRRSIKEDCREKEEEKERPKFFLYPEDEVQYPERQFETELPRSESVSLEDVDDIIRSEDNFRLLQEHYLLKRLQSFDTFPAEKSRSEESLSKFSYLRNRRFRESVPDIGEGQGFRPEKLKSSPPPEVQVQRSLIRDNRGSDKQSQSGISTDLHAQPDVSEVPLGVKCRVANFVNAPERYKSGGRGNILVSAESVCQDPLVGESSNWNNPCFCARDQEEPEEAFDSSNRPLKIRRDSCLSNVTINWEILQEDNSRSENEKTLLAGKDTSSRKKELKVSTKRSLKSRKRPRMKLPVKLIRFRERLILSLSAFAILFTIFLVMDLQLDLGYSGHHLVPSHGRVKFGDDPNRDTVYNNFRRKFLQRVNGSKEQSGGDLSGSAQTVKDDGVLKKGERTEKPKVHDDFSDLMEFVVSGDGVNVDDGVVRISGEDHTDNPTIGEIRKIPVR